MLIEEESPLMFEVGGDILQPSAAILLMSLPSLKEEYFTKRIKARYRLIEDKLRSIGNIVNESTKCMDEWVSSFVYSDMDAAHFFDFLCSRLHRRDRRGFRGRSILCSRLEVRGDKMQPKAAFLF
jgi:hypothetical protein